MNPLHRCAAALLSVCIALVAASTALAQAFPTKPVRLIIPSAPGSITDTLPRLMMPEMTRVLGQPIVADNMVGASGILGTRFVTKAPADGYTVLIIQTTATIASVFIKDLGYDLQKDLAPISLLVDSPIMLTAYDELPFNTFGEFIAYAKANPGKLNHGNPGRTDLFALYMGAIRSKFGVDIVDVAYKNSTDFLKAMSVNEVQVVFSTVGTFIQRQKERRAKGLAVTGDTRQPRLPNIPTFGEVGMPEVGGLKWMVFAPAGTPRPVVNRWNAAFVSGLNHPDVKPKLANLDMEVVGSTPEVLGQHLAQALERYQAIAKAQGIKPE